MEDRSDKLNHDENEVTEEQKSGILFYDPECGLCARFKQALQMIDSKKFITFKSIHAESTFFDHPELDADACFEVIHLIDNNGKIHQGADVINFLVGLIPAVGKFSWLLDSKAGKKAMDAFYGQINDMRSMKKRKCFTCGKGSKKAGHR